MMGTITAAILWCGCLGTIHSGRTSGVDASAFDVEGGRHGLHQKYAPLDCSQVQGQFRSSYQTLLEAEKAQAHPADPALSLAIGNFGSNLFALALCFSPSASRTLWELVEGHTPPASTISGRLYAMALHILAGSPLLLSLHELPCFSPAIDESVSLLLGIMGALMGRLMTVHQRGLLGLCHRADHAISAREGLEACRSHHQDYLVVRSRVRLPTELQVHLDRVVQKFSNVLGDAIRLQELSVAALGQGGDQLEEVQKLMLSMQPEQSLSLFTPQREKLETLWRTVPESKVPSVLASIIVQSHHPSSGDADDNAALLARFEGAQKQLAIEIFGQWQIYTATISSVMPPLAEHDTWLLRRFVEFEAPALLHLRPLLEAFLTLEYCAPVLMVRPPTIYQFYERLRSVGLLLQGCGPRHPSPGCVFVAATDPEDDLLQAATKAYTHLIREYRAVIVHLGGSPWLSPLPTLAEPLGSS